MKISILKSRQTEAFKELNKLIRRAHKTGNTDISFSVMREHTEKRAVEADSEGRVRYIEVDMVELEIHGEAPKFTEWEILAKIEMLQDGQLVQSFPGKEGEIEERFFSTDCFCEHCGIDRYRKDVYVVRNELTGEQKQIGRTCLRDFIGCDSPEKVAAKFKYLKELSEFSYGNSETWFEDVQHILEIAAASIRTRGFMSKARATVESPATSAIINMELQNKFPTEYINLKPEVIDEDRLMAKNTIEYFETLDTKSEYEFNCKQLISGKTIYDKKYIGYLASTINAYLKFIGEENKKLNAPKSDSKHVGEVGERMKDVELHFLDYRVIDGNGFGEYNVCRFIDHDGNFYTWFTGSFPSGWSTHTSRVCTFTVKRHDEYKGTLQTVINRLKVVDLGTGSEYDTFYKKVS